MSGAIHSLNKIGVQIHKFKSDFGGEMFRYCTSYDLGKRNLWTNDFSIVRDEYKKEMLDNQLELF